MTESAADLLLYGVFRSLIDRHVPLGVADYLDGLRALRMGFGVPGGDFSSGRNELRKLCLRLWARTVDEARLIDSLFGEIPQPSADEAQAVARALPQRDMVATEPLHKDASDVRSDEVEAPPEPKIPVHFQTRRDTGGIPLPPMTAVPCSGAELFVLRPQVIVSQRTLAVLWRRLRSLTRSGPKTELDVDGTVAARYRQGLLADVVLRPSRANRARLLVLADVSTSMAPWMPFLDTLRQSLMLSQLRDARLLYFNNVPRRSLFRLPSLGGAVPASDLAREFSGAALLLMSDAGAARGHLDHGRLEETQDFLERQSRSFRSIVFINPMPRRRWGSSTAAVLAQRCRAAVFLPLDVPSLIRAVDILRGARIR